MQKLKTRKGKEKAKLKYNTIRACVSELPLPLIETLYADIWLWKDLMIKSLDDSWDYDIFPVIRNGNAQTPGGEGYVARMKTSRKQDELKFKLVDRCRFSVANFQRYERTQLN